MRSFLLYISLAVFVTCIAAPSVAVWAELTVKETKVAKLFDMEEEEDARDNDSEKETEKEKETENNLSEKFFKGTLTSTDYLLGINNRLIHHTRFHFYILDASRDLITPPPRA